MLLIQTGPSFGTKLDELWTGIAIDWINLILDLILPDRTAKCMN